MKEDLKKEYRKELNELKEISMGIAKELKKLRREQRSQAQLDKIDKFYTSQASGGDTKMENEEAKKFLNTLKELNLTVDSQKQVSNSKNTDSENNPSIQSNKLEPISN